MSRRGWRSRGWSASRLRRGRRGLPRREWFGRGLGLRGSREGEEGGENWAFWVFTYEWDVGMDC